MGDQSGLGPVTSFYELLMFVGILEKCNEEAQVFINISVPLLSGSRLVMSSIMQGAHRVVHSKGMKIEYKVFSSYPAASIPHLLPPCWFPAICCHGLHVVPGSETMGCVWFQARVGLVYSSHLFLSGLF